MAKRTFRMIDNSKSVAIGEDGNTQALGMANFDREFHMICDTKNLPTRLYGFEVSPYKDIKNEVILREVDTMNLVITRKEYIEEITKCALCGHRKGS